MNLFAICDRVELKSSPGIHGTVLGFKRGGVRVQFDDFPEACSVLRPGSLQPAIDKNFNSTNNKEK